MSITIITGKPGDGKTLFAVRQLLKVLIETECYVVTNIPLRLDNLNAYVSSKREGFVLDERLKCIDDSLVYEFYRVRSGGLLLDPSPDFSVENTKRIDRPEFIARMKAQFLTIAKSVETSRPVHYYIDEAHNYFSAREWAAAGRGILYYASQHRHLHDEITLITQVIENVEKQLRGLVAETYVTKNNYKRRIGPIRMPAHFVIRAYYGSQVGHTNAAFQTNRIKLDIAGVASCYKTVGALGVHAEPEKQKAKAPLPFWTLPVGAAVCIIALFCAFTFGPAMAADFMKAKLVGLEVPTKAAGVVLDNARATDSQHTEVQKVEKPDSHGVSKIEVLGILRRAGLVRVYLSDGSILDQSLIAQIGLDGVADFRGRVYPFRRPPPPPPPAAGTVIAPALVASPVAPSVSSGSMSSVGAWVTDSYGVQHIVDSEATRLGSSR